MTMGSTRISRRGIVMTVATAAVALSLAACSSGSAEPTAESPAAVATGGDVAGTDEMRALCDQMVADGMSTEDATALAESSGFTARVGTIDGQPQAVTMDYREDRFTFDVESDTVVGCTYG
jgi:hypothetical protein